MLSLLGDFIGELRAVGIPISMSEHVDSARAMEVIDLSDRSLVKSSLAATLIKDGDHMPAFNTAFEVFFATRAYDGVEAMLEGEGPNPPDGAAGATGPGQSRGEGGASGSLSAQELAELLFRALRDANRDALRHAASEAVTRYAGIEPGRPVGGTYYLYRTLGISSSTRSRSDWPRSRSDHKTPRTPSPSDFLAMRHERVWSC